MKNLVKAAAIALVAIIVLASGFSVIGVVL